MTHEDDLLALPAPGSWSEHTIALCSAIVSDADLARAFDLDPGGAIELLRLMLLCAAQEIAPAPADRPLPI